ncbi:peptidase, A24 (type IV prepilin peptidase) family [Treponema primitia ZAS-2]|uniref:Peptidase, A24 (Type IV prepilin peptidase) family n=2 Tax=Treponema primitia TaxID=88058 RepID=F5YQP3_TREPZ|nr:peptidase, A24 (type IV prepilin peptidase) family [Treponema primitia ZAS-2]
MALPVFLTFLFFALPASWIDIRSFRIPDRLIFPGLGAALLVQALVSPRSLPGGIGAAVLSVLFFLFIRKIAGGLGLGDVKFAALMGLCCGPWVSLAFLGASLAGILGFLFLRLFKKDQFRRPLPFAPFMTAGTVGVFFLSRFCA